MLEGIIKGSISSLGKVIYGIEMGILVAQNLIALAFDKRRNKCDMEIERPLSRVIYIRF